MTGVQTCALPIYVAITHMHTDHVGSLPSLIFYNHYAKNIKTHLVSGDKTKDNNLKLFLKLTGVERGFFDFCSKDLNNAFEKIDSCTFEKVEHTKALDQSYAVMLALKNDVKVFYSGDTCDTFYAKNVIDKINPKDEFYCDCCLLDYPGNVHFNVDKLAQITPKDKRKQIFCMHIDREELLQKIDEYGFGYAKTNCEIQERSK